MKERARRAREGAERACDASDLCVSSRVSNMITIKEEKYWRNIQLFTRSYFVQEKKPSKTGFYWTLPNCLRTATVWFAGEHHNSNLESNIYEEYSNYLYRCTKFDVIIHLPAGLAHVT